jgi:hypothetical protein
MALFSADMRNVLLLPNDSIRHSGRWWLASRDHGLRE